MPRDRTGTMIASAAVLRGQLAAKQVEIRAMREFAADQNPDLQRAEQELAGIEGQLSAMDAASDRRTGDLIAVKGTVTQASLDFARSLREVKYRETIQDLLTRQYEGARVDEARQGPLVQIVDPAVVPDRPVYLIKVWCGLGALLGALLRWGFACCARRRNACRSSSGAEQVRFMERNDRSNCGRARTMRMTGACGK